MQTKVLQLPSTDGKHKLHVVVWEPDTQVVAIVQISHGMVEFIERYEPFAKYLTELGYLVIGNDHLGHGQSAGSDEDLGYFCPENMSATVVDDLHEVTKYAKEQYPGVPYILFGHSMGSFMARRYIMTYGNELTAAIICGTGRQAKATLAAGGIAASIVGKLKGDRYRSQLLKNLSFGSYNAHIKPARTANDWLTRDKDIVDWYNAEKYCTFLFTVNGYRTILEVLGFIQNEKNIKKIPSRLPILLIAGDEDPVGEYGKGVEAVYNQLKSCGLKRVTMKLYKGYRHEILNEIGKETVYDDVAAWIDSTIKKDNK